MDKKQKTVVAVVFIALVAVVGLWNVDLSQGYMTISELKLNSDQYLGHDINTMGIIKNDTLSMSTAGISFVLQDIEDPSLEVDVEYTGSLPANLAEGSSISISGMMTTRSSVEADQIVMGCPSKYSA
jgi:cytochrome c-type biogenesis protein CcmE